MGILTNDNPGGMTSPEHEPERNSREKQRTEQNSREQKRVTAQPTTDTPIHAKSGRYLRYISANFFGFSAKF